MATSVPVTAQCNKASMEGSTFKWIDNVLGKADAISGTRQPYHFANILEGIGQEVGAPNASYLG